MKSQKIFFPFLFTIGLLVVGWFFSSHQALAATLAANQMFGGSGDTFATTSGLPNGDLILIVARIIRAIIGVLGLVVVAFIIYGGYLWTTAGGEIEKVTKARKVMRNAIIGAVIILSSFAIAQFVISRVTEAINGTSSTTSSESGTGDDLLDTSSTFLVSVNNECSDGGIRNLALQFTFTKYVYTADIDDDAIAIYYIDSSAVTEENPEGERVFVAGSFENNGGTGTKAKRFTFVPDAPCIVGETTVQCFNENTQYFYTVDSALESTDGRSLTCDSLDESYACSGSFTTGEAFDLADPTSFLFSSPDEDDSLPVAPPTELQVTTEDDSGIAAVDFSVDDELLDSVGFESSSEGGLSPINNFSTYWDGSDGYLTNQDYTFSAEGYDCAGNSASAEVAAVLRADNCFDDLINEGETGLNCGGDSSGITYCGACTGDECLAGDDCASGVCEDGYCVAELEISRVSPTDGAPGNLITIMGSGFGTTGSVTFLGTDSSSEDDRVYSAYEGCTSTWTDTQIIVQIGEDKICSNDSTKACSEDIECEIPSDATCIEDPDGGETKICSDDSTLTCEEDADCQISTATCIANVFDGPISVQTTGDDPESILSDRTDDENGPLINDFDINTVARPGLCSITPSIGSGGNDETVVVQGNNFGSSVSYSALYFNSYGTTAFTGWGDSSFNTTVPLLNNNRYYVQLFTGNTEATKEGSNQLYPYTVSSDSSDPPVISSIDSGLKTCSDDNTVICSDSTDCTSTTATCNEDFSAGPAEQYITIYGSGFGSSEGSVWFENTGTSDDSGKVAQGNTDFPDVCDGANWHDTMIVIKVPDYYGSDSTDLIENITHNLSVERASDGADSEVVKFRIMEGTASPGVCLIDPSSGPVGSDVTLYGEGFSSDGDTVFFENKSAGWDTRADEMSTTSVPTGAQTGPVYIIDEDDTASNSLNFTVGDCTTGEVICTAPGSECCDSGICSTTTTSCDETSGKATYAFYFSTGEIPKVPEVKIDCSETTISPTPWESWTGGTEVCLNAEVHAEFTEEMNSSTISSSTVSVVRCDNDNCSSSTPVVMNGEPIVDPTVTSDFQWRPVSYTDGDETYYWEAGKTYRVTIKGGTGGVYGYSTGDNGLPMSNDYSWDFTTSSSGDLCEVGDVLITPESVTATEKGVAGQKNFSAAPIAAEYQCILLACDEYLWNFDTSDHDYATIGTPLSVCSAPVTPLQETDSGPVLVNAALDETDLSDNGYLTISFEKPTIINYWPNCNDACLNAQVGAEFNISMATDFGSFDSGGDKMVQIYKCEDPGCFIGEIIPITPRYSAVFDNDTNKLNVDLAVGSTFDADSFYRVVISGEAMSTSGSQLSVTDNTLKWYDDLSWVFQTGDTTCAVDRVAIEPQEAILHVVGETQRFIGVPYGAPDSCSAEGQRLNATFYDWANWLATDNPSRVIDAHVAEIFPGVSYPALTVSSILPSGCSSQCLHEGTTTPVAICGNYLKEPGEDCDYSGDGCSNRCLTQVSLSCGNGEQDDWEECDNGGLCGDNETICVDQEDCDGLGSGFCQDGETVCYTDNDCTDVEGTETDEGTCVGVDLSLEICAPVSGDGCSSGCLNEGSAALGLNCGDGYVTQSIFFGGEECDSEENCSDNCLHLGSEPASYYSSGVCGNNIIELGEDCDDDNIVSGDGCSSTCLNEGSIAGHSVCGNNTFITTRCVSNDDCTGARIGTKCNGLGQCVSAGEDCDDGNTVNDDGCSSNCLSEGSSDSSYTRPVICGNAILESGEECEVITSTSTVFGVPNYAVAFISPTAPEEVSAALLMSRADYATSRISVQESDNGTSIHSATANLVLECSCKNDEECGNTDTIGCGDSGCCFTRPEFLSSQPGVESGVCRNTAVWATFDKVMDIGLIESGATISLVLVPDSDDNFPASTLIPQEYIASTIVAVQKTEGNIFARAWHWLVFQFSRIFNPASAAETVEYYTVPVEYSLEPTMAGLVVTGSKVNLSYSSALIVGGNYELRIVGEGSTSDFRDGVINGAASSDGVGLLTSRTINFTVGSEICTVDLVEVTDTGTTASATNPLLDSSTGLFTQKNEVHNLTAVAYSLHEASREAITQTTDYSWTWSWGSSIGDSAASNVLSTASAIASPTCIDDPDDGDTKICSDDETTTCLVDADCQIFTATTATTVTAAGIDGKEQIIATAIISDSTSGTETESEVNGTKDLSALLCANPWPDLAYFPFEDVSASTAASYFGLTSTYTNFSFYYCRDFGEEATTDDLPDLSVKEVSSSPDPENAEIMKDLLFVVNGTSDAIGVRVLTNTNYLSPLAWYEAQGFTGSPSETTLDGYQAVKDGNTYYVAASNVSGTGVYSNIYVISYNQGASDEATNIFEQIISHWNFNANDQDVSDINLCLGAGGAYSQVGGEYVSCSWDQECLDADLSVGTTCNAEKAKLTRDLHRLTDITEIKSIISAYGEDNGHCKVTKNQECTIDGECPGGEVCLPEVPDIQSGTYLSAFTASTWPSWNAVLANDLGQALPTDPINEFVSCPDGYNDTDCWNSVSGTFICDEGSHAYLYRSIGGEEYDLAVQLENSSVTWSDPIDSDSSDIANIYVEYASGTSGGFYAAANSDICDGSAIGNSLRCGDGVQGTGEVCEIGDIDSISCTDGNITIACIDVSGTCRYQTAAEAAAAEAECVPEECGNGITETGEECDDGSLNGTYGYCDSDCQLDGAFYCGDGYLAGGEQCDCGESRNFSTVMADSYSWAKNHSCISYNGQYSSNYSVSCNYDCSYPGPSCGDGELNGSETCDGNYLSWSGSLCHGGSNDLEECTVDSDCSGGTCGGVDHSGYEACSISKTCESSSDGSMIGRECSTNSDCNGRGSGGVCSGFEYQLYRTRTCDDNIEDVVAPSCDWNDWSDCVGGDQVCGNGILEGDEECDDGNTDSTDSCTAECLLNICGDGYKYTGFETCDDGAENGLVCTSDYEDSCAYCNVSCQYMTKSGSYCGDGTLDESEYCDGGQLRWFCYRQDINPEIRAIDTSIDCSKYLDYGYVSSAAYCKAELCPAGTYNDKSCTDYPFTCESSVGVCNGGSYLDGETTYLYNGESCLLGSAAGETARTCGRSVSGSSEVGICSEPNCSADCASTCPFAYNTTSILIKEGLAGAEKSSSADLYSYFSSEEPDTATLYLPACEVGTQITADIDNSDITPPPTDIVFVIDLSASMDDTGPMDDSSTSEVETSISVGVEVLSQTIDDLFDAYGGSGAQLRIALVNFTGERYHSTDWGGTLSEACITSTDGSTPLAFVDYALTTDQSELMYGTNGVQSYLDRLHYGTPTAAGLLCAKSILTEDSTVDSKIVILLSDGLPNVRMSDGIDGDGSDYVSTAASEARAATNELIAAGIEVYSAALPLSSSTTITAYMEHFSSDECGTNLTSTSDCLPGDNGEYAYRATNADDFEAMFEAIVGNILGIQAGLTTEFLGSSEITIGTISSGNDVVLTFPEGFECPDSTTDTEWEIPIRFSFRGTGSVNISDIKLNYCPLESTTATITSGTGDQDSDNDGIPDDSDPCPTDPHDLCLAVTSTDTDGDGIENSVDNCLLISNVSQSDSDNDGADGYGDACDNCPDDKNSDQDDTDVDLIGNVCDNCPGVSNSDQTDTNVNGVGDVCDCGDGILSGEEVCEVGILPIYCVKNAIDPANRNAELMSDCSDVSACDCSSVGTGYEAAGGENLGLCNGGTRYRFNFDGHLCSTTDTSNYWDCGADDTAGSCEVDTCESDCSDSYINSYYGI